MGHGENGEARQGAVAARRRKARTGATWRGDPRAGVPRRGAASCGKARSGARTFEFHKAEVAQAEHAELHRTRERAPGNSPENAPENASENAPENAPENGRRTSSSDGAAPSKPAKTFVFKSLFKSTIFMTSSLTRCFSQSCKVCKDTRT